MRRSSGQAALGLATVLHWLATLAITLAVLASVGAAALAWRLSQGPMDLDWFTRRLEDAANSNGGPTRLTIGAAALAWEGFSHGVDRPLDLRLTNVTIADHPYGRRMTIPRADVSLSLHGLLLGRVVPRAVTLEAPQLTLIRRADGTLSLDLGSLMEGTDGSEPAPPDESTPVADLLAELAQPPANDTGDGRNRLLEQLRLVNVQDGRLAVVDRQLGVTWRATRVDVHLARQARGGVGGTAELSLLLGEQQANLSLAATLTADASDTHVRARLSPVTPRLVAGDAPSLAALSAVDVPIGGEVSADLDGSLRLRDARFTLHAGSGQVRIDGSDVPVLAATLVGSGRPDLLTVQTLQVSLPSRMAGQPTVLEVRGTLRLQTEHINADLSADLNQVSFADLAQFWPEHVGRGARRWLLTNIPAGTARNGHVELGLAASTDLSLIDLTRATGTLDGDGLQVHWLRPVPPIDNGQAQLRILDPDTLEIAVTGGRERIRNQPGNLQIRSGRVRITGIMQSHQIGVIDADITGPLPDALALLREPRLALLDRHPMDLQNPAGQVAVRLGLTVPLEDSVRMDDIAVQAQARLDGIHLTALAAGLDLDQGTFDLTANPEGMKLGGRGLLGQIPAKIDASMDFRAGPPSQVVQSVTVAGQPDARQLAAIGLDATQVLTGVPQIQAVLSERRNGQGDIAISADLTGTELSVAPLEWRKPREVPAKASARVLLDHDRVTSIDAVQLDGDGLTLRGRALVASGRVASLQIERLVLGRTIARGRLELPPAGPVAVDISGSVLDLAPRLGRRSPQQTAKKTEQPGPSWTLDARFDRVLMAQGGTASDVTLHAEDDGHLLRQLRLDGRLGVRAPFQARIVSDGAGRRLSASAQDAGELLRGLDYVRSMQGGRLSVEAQYEDTQPGRPLAGIASIDDFRVRDAPALAKLLQAMTLYGLTDVVRGPGLGFSRLVAPFRLTDDALDLADARAFSASLGMTMKGRLDLDTQRMDMQGTIVPAYFFNSMLGNIPLVGKLFSPERGGGVFAASYTVRGRVEDPEVSVNPLAALTPGFLRGLFGLF